MRNPLVLRILSAAILAPLALLAAYYGGYVFALLLVVFSAIMGWEWEKMCSGKFGVAGIKISMFVLLVIGLTVRGRYDVAFVFALIGAAGVYWSAGRFNKDLKPSWLAFAVPYIALPSMSLILIRDVGGALPLFWLFAVVWGTDIGAYFSGRAIGGPLLAPRISPNKTWAGAVGGLAAAMVLSAVFVLYLGFGDLISLVAFGALLSVVSQMGDLGESAIKRRFGVKDSSNIIPGHGGVFDRVDGLLAAAPPTALLVYFHLLGAAAAP